MNILNSIDFDGDPSSGFSNLTTINLSSNIYNSSMSNPSNSSSVQFPTYSFPTSTASSAASSVHYPTGTPPPPTPATTSQGSIFNYVTGNTYAKDVMADMGELIIVFVTSAGLSYYMGDEWDTALKRGSIMSGAQFIGGAVAYGTLNIGNVNLTLVGDFTKFVFSSLLFMGGNKYILDSEQPVEILLRESLFSAVVAHYGARTVQNYVDKTQAVASQYTSMY